MNLILNIYKESGLSSFDVIRNLRKHFNVKKFGYIGTLDPFATGVLPVLSGEFTKLIPFIQSNEKSYRFVIVLGVTSDTLDITGNHSKRVSFPEIDIEEVSECISENFLGLREQVPPRYSAIKINGKRAYKLARENKDIEMIPRPVELRSFIIKYAGNGRIEGHINTSRGFYVRSFARDLAQQLSTIGMLAELERTSSGLFSVENSIRLEHVTEHSSVEIDSILPETLKIRMITDEDYIKLRNGVSMDTADPEGIYLSVNDDRTKMIVCEAKDSALRTIRVIL